MPSILIAGDFAPKDRIATLVDDGQWSEIFENVRPTILNADFALVNLEAPIVCGVGTPIKKAGPNLKSGFRVIEAIKYAGFKGVTLANNHFYDYGEEGALTTMSCLEEAGLHYVGAGRNLTEAAKVFYAKIEDKIVAFINCCEHEYSIATNLSCGSNPLNPVKQYGSIKEARDKADYVIVIVHGGIEHFQLPTPRMQETYRFFIDAGADAVVNHHQHCYSGYEVYHDKAIFYGLGNFCFDWKGKRDSIWNEGYMVLLHLGNRNAMFDIIPYKQCNNLPKVLLTEDKDIFLKQVAQLNDIITDEHKLEQTYEEFMIRTDFQYNIVSPYGNRYLNALFKRGYLPSFIPKKIMRSLQNKVTCESHRERFIHALNNKLK